jgi:hypothetical protein
VEGVTVGVATEAGAKECTLCTRCIHSQSSHNAGSLMTQPRHMLDSYNCALAHSSLSVSPPFNLATGVFSPLPQIVDITCTCVRSQKIVFLCGFVRVVLMFKDVVLLWFSYGVVVISWCSLLPWNGVYSLSTCLLGLLNPHSYMFIFAYLGIGI